MSDVSTDQLSEYLEGDLDDESRARVEAAIAADPALGAELEELKALLADLGGMPEVEAPAGLLGNVMAAVADLPIPVADPGLEAANGEQIAAASASAGAGAEVAAANDTEEDNVVRVAWWIRGPAVSAIAALLVVGFGVWIYGQRAPMTAPVASSVRPGFAPEAAAPVAAPSMTGGVEADALVEADDAEEVRERLRAIAAADAVGDGDVMPDTTPGVARGTMDPRPPRSAPKAARAPARSAPRPQPAAETVFVAEYERGEDGIEVAAVEELDEEAGERSLSLEEVSFGASPTAPRGGAATLSLTDGDKSAVVNALRVRGWGVTPAGSGFQVTVPEGSEEALVTLLRKHGRLTIESPMRSMRDGKARLVVAFE